MNEQEIRERIRELMVSGALPPVLGDGARVNEDGRGVPAQADGRTVDVGSCAICGQPGPQISYYFPGDSIQHFHASCDLLWQEERAR